ncbi:MAG TPA: hypothetical protein VHE35_26800 [Kofleriaceae bacterium]|nr:hypothetical protein [Kofleriaceae bacterium]
MRRAAALALALAAGVGCGRRSPTSAAKPHDASIDAAPRGPRATTVALDSVQVELHGRADHVIDARALGRSLARCLIESGAPVVALAEQAPPGQVVRHLELVLEIGVQEPQAAGDELAVTIDAASHWTDDALAPAPTASITGAATPRPARRPDVDPVDAATAAVVMELEPRLCIELTTRVQVWADDDLRTALAATDPAAARWALEVAADRDPPTDGAARVALINAIAPHLAGDPDVRDAAIDALVATHDPHAVAPLTAITDVDDEAALIRIIAAVARLGGDDARDYLQVMTSHHDRAVAFAARKALAALGPAPAPAP